MVYNIYQSNNNKWVKTEQEYKSSIRQRIAEALVDGEETYDRGYIILWIYCMKLIPNISTLY